MTTIKERISPRFEELAMKETLGTITPPELEKLERYSRLRLTDRERLTFSRSNPATDWCYRRLMKMAGRIIHLKKGWPPNKR